MPRIPCAPQPSACEHAADHPSLTLPGRCSIWQYCAGYFVALELVTRLRADKPAVESAVIRVEARFRLGSAEDGDLSLSACLIRPVKRLCLYPLLLNAVLCALRKATAGETTKRRGYELLEKAAEEVQSMAINVNDLVRPPEGQARRRARLKGHVRPSSNPRPHPSPRPHPHQVRQAESQIRMLSVHERLRGSYPGLLSPSRRLVREDKVQSLKRVHVPGCAQLQASELDLDGVNDASRATKRESGGSGGGKSYQLWLFNDRLLLARPDRFSDQFFHLKEDMPLAQLRLAWSDEGRTCIAPQRALSTAEPSATPASEPQSFWLLCGANGFLLTCVSQYGSSTARSLYDAIGSTARAHIDLASTLERRTAAEPAARTRSVACSLSASGSSSGSGKGKFLSWLVGRAAVSAAAAARAVAQADEEARAAARGGAATSDDSVPRKSSLPQVTLNACTLDPRWVQESRNTASPRKAVSPQFAHRMSSSTSSSTSSITSSSQSSTGAARAHGDHDGPGDHDDAYCLAEHATAVAAPDSPRRMTGSTQPMPRDSTQSLDSRLDAVTRSTPRDSASAPSSAFGCGGRRRSDASRRASALVATARWHRAAVDVASVRASVRASCRRSSSVEIGLDRASQARARPAKRQCVSDAPAASDEGLPSLMAQRLSHTASLIEGQGDAINHVLRLRRERSSACFTAEEDVSGSSAGPSGPQTGPCRASLQSAAAVVLEEDSGLDWESARASQPTGFVEAQPAAVATESEQRQSSASLALAGVPYATDACIAGLPRFSGFSAQSGSTASIGSSCGDAGVATLNDSDSDSDVVVLNLTSSGTGGVPPPLVPPPPSSPPSTREAWSSV